MGRKKVLVLTILIVLIFVLSVVVAYIAGLSEMERTYEENIKSGRDKSSLDLFVHTVRQSSYMDSDGDGSVEKVLLFTPDTGFENFKDSKFGFIGIYDAKGNEIAKTPDYYTPPHSTMEGNMVAVNLDATKKQYLQIIVPVGAHQMEQVFFGVRGGELLPVCKKEGSLEGKDCVFYTTRGTLITEDIDKDTYVEAIELTDEYPPEGGRRRTVVWGIYKFNGTYFEPQEGQNYEKIYSIFTQNRNPSDIMRKSELSQKSLDYFNRIKDFWGGK